MRKNKWKTEQGYFTVPKKGKTFREISEILSEEEGRKIPQSTVNNVFRNGMIKIVNHIANELDKDVDAEFICRSPEFRSSLMDIMKSSDFEEKKDDSDIIV
tara:strand:+ start:433 stop:735 length:303 start_codon:yes stop_codon:yes gene_type:complete